MREFYLTPPKPQPVLGSEAEITVAGGGGWGVGNTPRSVIPLHSMKLFLEADVQPVTTSPAAALSDPAHLPIRRTLSLSSG